MSGKPRAEFDRREVDATPGQRDAELSGAATDLQNAAALMNGSRRDDSLHDLAAVRGAVPVIGVGNCVE